MSNNRDTINKKLITLKDEYDDLDRFFFSNFKIVTENRNSFLKAKPYSVVEYTRRIDLIKRHIAELWRLCNTHTGGWFDNDEKRELDKRNRHNVYEIEQKVNKLMALYMHYEVIE